MNRLTPVAALAIAEKGAKYSIFRIVHKIAIGKKRTTIMNLSAFSQFSNVGYAIPVTCFMLSAMKTK